MNCIIVDDEPLGRKAIQLLVQDTPTLTLCRDFGDTLSAGKFMRTNPVDLIFLDIKMPGVNGLDFARTIPANTLVIFVTAYAEYALDSYEVDALDYLVKPIEMNRFKRAVEKACTYHALLSPEINKGSVESVSEEHIFVKAERRYFKVQLKHILFVEGLKDYVVIQTSEQRLITKMNLKSIHELLPKDVFLRVNKSFIVNTQHIDSFDNNDVFISKYEISIGNSYRDYFFEKFFR